MQPIYANPLAAYAAGQQLGQERQKQNVLAQNAAGIAQGDPNALAALAQYDPTGAFNMGRAVRSDAIAEEDRQFQRGRILQADQRAVEASRLEYEKHIASLGEAEREAAKQETEMILSALSAGDTPEKWDDIAIKIGAPEYVGRFEDGPMLFNRALGLKSALEMQQPDGEYERYVREEQTAGRQPLTRLEYNQANKSKGLSVKTNPDGSMELSQGGPNNQYLPMTSTPDKGIQRVFNERLGSWEDAPIAGSPLAEERRVQETKMDLANSSYNRKYQTVEKNTDRAIKSIEDNGNWVAGFGSLLSQIPTTEARTLKATIDTIKANLGFEELQEMRDNSPTGGALGNVTEREIEFLQAVQGNLDLAQKPEDVLRVLKDIKETRAKFKAERERIMAGGEAQVEPGDFEAMSIADLKKLDTSSMNDSDLSRWIAVMKAKRNE